MALRSQTALTLRHVHKVYREEPRRSTVAINDVSLRVRAQEFFVIVGPSGSGKSTLLRILGGIEQATQGAVRLGRDLVPADISMVFQQFALLPWLTVAENVELGLLAREPSRARRRERVQQELTLLGLGRFRKAYPRELSGGMQQRVGIARALVTDPKILLLDEPFSELDSFTAQELRAEVLEIWTRRHPTIVMVTHIIEEALLLADRIAVLTPRPGRIERILDNPLPRPRDRRSPSFFSLEDTLQRIVQP